MQRISILLFGVFSYGVFFLVFLYLIAWIGNLQLTPVADRLPGLRTVVPYSIDAGRAGGDPIKAVLVNLSLIVLFGLQHSVMARRSFKKGLYRFVPESAGRSVYVLLSSIVLVVLMWQWRPISIPIWEVEAVWGQALTWTGFVIGWGIVLLATFLIDHFDLFGLKQVWLQFRGRQYTAPRFRAPLFYRFVRHPLYLGFLLAFWSTPLMSVGHLLFAAGMSSYILIGILFEERDLRRFHGSAYERYRAQVPMLVPLPGRGFRAD